MPVTKRRSPAQFRHLPLRTHQVATRYTRAEYELIAEAARAADQEFGPFVREIAVAAARAQLGLAPERRAEAES
jgi:uncharacterized protein (DUF1778 family)